MNARIEGKIEILVSQEDWEATKRHPMEMNINGIDVVIKCKETTIFEEN